MVYGGSGYRRIVVDWEYYRRHPSDVYKEKLTQPTMKEEPKKP